jgi:putative ABC transport system permease protein
MRSGLTALGILVGISAVVLLTSIGEGVRVFVLSEFTQFGTNLVAVVPGKTNTFGTSGATIKTVRPLSIDDAEALARLERVVAAVPVIQGNAAVEYGSLSRRTTLLGVGPAVPDVWRMRVKSGRFLPDDDFRTARAFAVLGAKTRDELFGQSNPLGKRIRIGGDRYRIIGVMEPKGQMLGFDLDDTVYVPIGKAMELFDRESLMEIDLLYRATDSPDQVQADVNRLMMARHGREDFTLITQDQMLDVLDSILNILTLGVGALGSISLLVGMVGILAVMTIAVSERTAEIGLLRALGARQQQILMLFLTEALLLASLGGLLGAALAMGLVILLGHLAPDLPLQIRYGYVAAALILSMLIGLAAGVLPAMRAAAMRPLEALRTE